jgi:hypothetical protein
VESPTSRFDLIKIALIIFTLLLTPCTPKIPLHEKQWNYSYYLFELPHENEGCSDCYIPLLVTRKPLAYDSDQEAVIFITYERDSIWSFRQKLARITGESIDEPARKIQFEGKIYRYQLIPNDETISLLRNPIGHIPVSGPGFSIPYETKESLLKDLSHD